MSLKMTTEDVVQLIRNGASVHVSAADYSSSDIVQFARNLKEGCNLTVVHSGSMSHDDLIQVVRNGKDRVVLA